jgi:hypothetical protein
MASAYVALYEQMRLPILHAIDETGTVGTIPLLAKA